MAPQTIEKAPNTLPENFDEWDGGGPPAALPATLPDDFFDKIDTPPAAPAKVAKAQTVAMPAPAKVPDKTAARKAKTAPVAAVAIPAPSRPRPSSVEPEKESKDKEKSPAKGIAIGSTLLVLVLAGVLVPRMITKSAAKTVAVNQPLIMQPTATSTAPAPSSAQTTLTPSSPLQQQAAAAQTAQQPHSVDPGKMVDQLVAPSRIANNINGQDKELGSSQNFSASGLEGLGGSSGAAIGSVMGGTAHPKVNFAAPKSVSISSGVASGLLLQRRDPIYPALAKQSNVSGTVVLEATISKSGTIQGVHVLSGPVMLRQAAMDAVGSWRYRPYMLDSQPVDVQTTINLTFSLGR
jgi:protein TonB